MKKQFSFFTNGEIPSACFHFFLKPEMLGNGDLLQCVFNWISVSKKDPCFMKKLKTWIKSLSHSSHVPTCGVTYPKSFFQWLCKVYAI